MRLFSFIDGDGEPAIGLLEDDRLSPLAAGRLDGSRLEPDGLSDLRARAAAGGRGAAIDPASVRPAPAAWPSKVIAIGLNYRDHLAEQHRPPPARPTLFAKLPTSIVASGEPVVRPPGTRSLDLEVELGVVIGRRATRVPSEAAMGHVAGYLVANDVTARNWQGNGAALEPGEQGDGQWLRAKGSDTFLPLGPILATADEIADPGALRLRSWRVPGRGPDAGRPLPMQDGRASDMLFDIATLIEFVSGSITLEPGDLLITGTPSGVGVFREPPVFLEPGDRAICEIDGLGRVDNPIIDAGAADREAAATSPSSQESA